MQPRLTPNFRWRVPGSFLDYLLFWPGIWLACILGAGIRPLGSLFTLIPAACLLYALLQRVIPPRILGLYILFCTLVALLSTYELFPSSWQTHFLPEAIVRQIAPTFAFFLVSWAAKAYFRKQLSQGDVFKGSRTVMALSFGGAFLTMCYLHLGYEGDYSPLEKLALLGAFLNNTLIGMFFVSGYIYLSRDWRRYAALTLVIAIGVITHFIQFRLWAAATLLTALGIPGRKVAVGVVALLVGGYALGMCFAPQLMQRDPNDGLRVVMLRDALSSVLDTGGLGIGYGKESVRAKYSVTGMPDFHFLPDWSSMTRQRLLEALSSSVENSFIMTLLRTGILGVALLVASISVAFPLRGLPAPTRNHAAGLFAMSFIASFVNAGFDTPLQVVGHGFLYGYLLALRGHWKSLTLRAMPVQSRLPSVDAARTPVCSPSGPQYLKISSPGSLRSKRRQEQAGFQGRSSDR